MLVSDGFVPAAARRPRRRVLSVLAATVALVAAGAAAGCGSGGSGGSVPASLTRQVPLGGWAATLTATPVQLSGSLAPTGATRTLSIRWRLTNTKGAVLPVQAPSQSALVDAGGHPTRGAGYPTLPTTGAPAPLVAWLGPGETLTASIPYVVPAGASVRTVRFGRLLTTGAAPAFGAAEWAAETIPTRPDTAGPPAVPGPLLAPGATTTLTATTFASAPGTSGGQTGPDASNPVHLAVTLRRVVDPAPAQNGGAATGPAGSHLVVAEFDVRNVGTTPSWDPAETSIFDTQGQDFSLGFTFSGLGPDTPAQTLEAGARLSVLRTVEVQDGVQLRYVQFVLGGGSGNVAVGRWRVR
ncbi:hypothetical protein [Pseudofrankia saprophytica]|uniref:hypothetical protein n=1 Tax=Pseudofrankia saprophytica TaxID=298655 RepID=UPI000234BA23|nr:hypothetical protein [Pseudofrankia saprophytica]